MRRLLYQLPFLHLELIPSWPEQAQIVKNQLEHTRGSSKTKKRTPSQSINQVKEKAGDQSINQSIDWMLSRSASIKRLTSFAWTSSRIFSRSKEERASKPGPRVDAGSVDDSTEENESAEGVGEHTSTTDPVKSANICEAVSGPGSIKLVLIDVRARFISTAGWEVVGDGETVRTFLEETSPESSGLSDIALFPFWISSFFIPAWKHLFNRHFWHHLRDSTSIRQVPLKGHLNSWKQQNRNQSSNQAKDRLLRCGDQTYFLLQRISPEKRLAWLTGNGTKVHIQGCIATNTTSFLRIPVLQDTRCFLQVDGGSMRRFRTFCFTYDCLQAMSVT
jgi:hypothetical protein